MHINSAWSVRFLLPPLYIPANMYCTSFPLVSLHRARTDSTYSYLPPRPTHVPDNPAIVLSRPPAIFRTPLLYSSFLQPMNRTPLLYPHFSQLMYETPPLTLYEITPYNIQNSTPVFFLPAAYEPNATPVPTPLQADVRNTPTNSVRYDITPLRYSLAEVWRLYMQLYYPSHAHDYHILRTVGNLRLSFDSVPA